jgi:lysophospholipase L1-like esterase
MSSTSWYFLDELEMTGSPATRVIVAFGDSITDGTASTLNGDDRWPDVFARRLHAASGNRFSVVNEGIGGNQVVGPTDYATKPIPGGPSALDRLQRDVISLPGVSAVIWLEGINDFGAAGASAQAVSDGVREGVKRLREGIPGVRIYMATLTGALNSTPTHGTPEVEAKRKEYNNFIRNAGIFDGVVDFDVITLDPKTGELKAEYQPNSTTGGPGDKLHPNRAGYAAMGNGVDLIMILGK